MNDGQNHEETFVCGCGSLLHVFHLAYLASDDNALYLNVSTCQNRGMLNRVSVALKILFNKTVRNGLYDPILVNNNDLKRMYNICSLASEDTCPSGEVAIDNDRYRLYFLIDQDELCRVYIEIHQKRMQILQKLRFLAYYVLRFKAKYGVEKFRIDPIKAAHLKGVLGFTHLIVKDLS